MLTQRGHRPILTEKKAEDLISQAQEESQRPARQEALEKDAEVASPGEATRDSGSETCHESI